GVREMLGRCGLCLAASTHRPLWFILVLAGHIPRFLPPVRPALAAPWPVLFRSFGALRQGAARSGAAGADTAPVPASHTFTVPSTAAETRRRPSGLNSRVRTGPFCRGKENVF